jgi:hypothetical protein
MAFAPGDPPEECPVVACGQRFRDSRCRDNYFCAVAGIETIPEGQIALGGRRVRAYLAHSTGVSDKKRNLGLRRYGSDPDGESEVWQTVDES